MQTESQANGTNGADDGEHYDGFEVSFDERHGFVFGGANVMLTNRIWRQLHMAHRIPHRLFGSSPPPR